MKKKRKKEIALYFTVRHCRRYYFTGETNGN